MESIYLLSKSRFILLFLRSKYKKKKEKKNLLFDSEPWNQSTKHPRNYDLSSLRRVPALDSTLRTRLQSSTKLLRRWLCGSPPHPCAHPHRRLSLFSKSVSVFPYTDPASRVCECWFSVRVGTRACVGECDWRVCESPYIRSDVTCAAYVCKRGEPITPTTAPRSRDHIDQSGSEFGAVPRATANMAALGAGEHSAGEETLLTSLVDTTRSPSTLLLLTLSLLLSDFFFIFFVIPERRTGKKDRVLRGFHFLRGRWLWK